MFTIISTLVRFSAAFAAVVPSPPLITKQPPSDEILFQVALNPKENDKPFTIECEAKGEPEPKYRWVKNGKEFNWKTYGNRMSQKSGRGAIVVTTPRDEDERHYQCFAFNEWGTATSNSVFVRKVEPNSFKDKDKEFVTKVADEGKPFELKCSAPGGWSKPSVSWMLQNQLGAIKSIDSSRITVDPEGSLWFSNVTETDRSSQFYYACSAYSPFRHEYKLGNRVYLSVLTTNDSASQNKHKPVIQYATKRNTVALKGNPVSLWCIIGGTPLPEIKWTKKGSQLPYDRIEYDNYGKTLRIKDVHFEDEGSYDCDASNGVGTPVSHSVQLTVYAAPYFTIEPEIANATEGEIVEFRCEAEGRPAPEIKWIHNGKPLAEAPSNPRRKIYGNRIIIENRSKIDRGNYGCNATNSYGYVYKDVYISVLDKRNAVFSANSIGPTVWYFGPLIAVVLLILILIIVYFIQRNRRNRGRFVDPKENFNRGLYFNKEGFRKYSQSVEGRSERMSIEYPTPQDSNTDSKAEDENDCLEGEFTENGGGGESAENAEGEEFIEIGDGREFAEDGEKVAENGDEEKFIGYGFSGVFIDNRNLLMRPT